MKHNLTPRSDRPRLFFEPGGTERLREKLSMPEGRAMADRLLHDAGLMLRIPPQPRKVEGRRMLSASRTVLYRINTLGIVFFLTGDRRYAERAVAEALHAANYSDWHPEHFLDTAEMTLAVAIALDWFGALLTPEETDQLTQAILDKGLLPSCSGGQWWIKGTNNWNQVCHAGMTAGAIAVFECAPDFAREIIERAIDNVPRAMAVGYAPAGAYPEGPMYWAYGTEFNVALIAMLESAFGSDFGLAAQPGFDRTGDFLRATLTPSGRLFSYADSSTTRGISFALFWLMQRFQRPEWFTMAEQQLLSRYAKSRPVAVKGEGPRMTPLSLIYLQPPPSHVEPQLAYFSGAEAAVPIAVFRSAEKSGASYLGFKCGSPFISHGHMDAGSFFFEAKGVLWAADLGSESYHRLESRGVDLWNNRQHSGRWRIFRLGPASHNILLIDGEEQLVEGRAVITECRANRAVADLSTLYAGRALRVERRVALIGEAAVIHDRLAGLRSGSLVRFQFCTPAKAAMGKDGELTLSRSGCRVRLETSQPVEWEVTPEAALRGPDDSPNPGYSMVKFEFIAPPSGNMEYQVALTPLA